MDKRAILARINRLEAAAAQAAARAPIWLEARDEAGCWTVGGRRWVAADGQVYDDAGLERLSKRRQVILVTQHEVKHD